MHDYIQISIRKQAGGCSKLTAPCFIPIKTLLVNEDSLELRTGQSGMSVVQLDCNLQWELSTRPLGFLEATDNVEQGRSTPEVLLLQAKLFTTVEAVQR
jgi:hypothetical protein